MKKSAQLQFKKVNGWGGKRRGAGRKNKSGQVSHSAREIVTGRTPLHITIRLKPGLKNLRTAKMKAEFERCLIKAQGKGLRVIHLSLQSNHLHFIVECKDNHALASGMNSLGASFGRTIRRANGGKGKVFEGRFHVHPLKTPTEMKNALGYVLLNRSKHLKSIPYVDDFSSADYFTEWKPLNGKEWAAEVRPWPPHLSKAKSWLAREGWRRG